MAERKSFLLRVDRELLDAVQRWAGDDLRSLNGQIEFLLRRALTQSGRLGQRTHAPSPDVAPANDARTAATGDIPGDVPGDATARTHDIDATGEP